MNRSVKHRSLGPLALAAAIAVGLAANFGVPAERVVLSAAVTIPFHDDAPLDCDIDCCTGDEGVCSCDPGTHDAWDTVPNFFFWTRNGGVHAFEGDCREYPCDIRHGPGCPKPGGGPLTTDNLEQLRHAIVAQDVKVLSKLVGERNDIKLNLERSALQIENCKGRVTMHMPISTELARLVHAAATGAPSN